MPVGLVFAVLFSAMPLSFGRETEEHLIRKIQNEQNPVKKAKEEIKLAAFQLVRVQDAYSHGHIDEGAKLLGTFLETMKASWKILQGTGRRAAKQPQGFRELEISLRESIRTLQDVKRSVSYFDRAPLTTTSQQLEQMHSGVFRALFPGSTPRTGKGPATPSAGPGAGSSPEAR